MSKILNDLVATLTSRERLRQRLHISLYRNALYLIINSILTGVVGLVFWIIAARFYPVEDVGLASAAISAMMLLALLATMGLDYGLIRFLPDSGRDANAMINSCLTIGGLAAIILVFIFIAGLGFWSPALLFLRQDPIFFPAFVIVTVSYTLYMLLTRIFVAYRRAGFSLAQGIIFNILRLLMVILLAAFFAAFGIFASMGIGTIVAIGVSMFWFLYRVQTGYRFRPTIRTKVVNRIVRFSFANYIAGLLWSAPNFVLPMVVVNLLGAEDNAYFYIAWTIFFVLSMIPLSTSLSLFAEGSHQEERLGQDTMRSLKLTFSIIVPAIVLLLLIGDKILLIFGADYAENATSLLRILAISLIPLSLNAIYFGIKRVEMKMKGVIGLTSFIVVATLVLSWFLLNQMGILGIGLAWLSSQGVVALVIIIGFTLRRVALRKPVT
jgi:O-antigen/teichoic acid export membrane protein